MAGEWLVGLDLGQSQDFSALAAVEREPATSTGPAGALVGPVPGYAVRHLHRWPLRTPYQEVVRATLALLARPPLGAGGGDDGGAGDGGNERSRVALVVDGTGVGAAVVDFVRAAVLPDGVVLLPVLITGGDTVACERGTYRVPKRDLAGTLAVLLQNRRLRVAARLPEAPTLLAELAAFKVKITAAGTDTYGAWREGEHDDLVLAVALACWAGELGLTRDWAALGGTFTLVDRDRLRTAAVYGPPPVAGGAWGSSTLMDRLREAKRARWRPAAEAAERAWLAALGELDGQGG